MKQMASCYLIIIIIPLNTNLDIFFSVQLDPLNLAYYCDTIALTHAEPDGGFSVGLAAYVNGDMQ